MWRLEWAELCGRDMWWQRFQAGEEAESAATEHGTEGGSGLALEAGVTRICYVTDSADERCVPECSAAEASRRLSLTPASGACRCVLDQGPQCRYVRLPRRVSVCP